MKLSRISAQKRISSKEMNSSSYGKLPKSKAMKNKFMITVGTAQMPVAILKALSTLFSILMIYHGFWLLLNFTVGSVKMLVLFVSTVGWESRGCS